MSQYSGELTKVGQDAACSNLCATGRKLKNVGRVRLKVMINDYCPFYGMRAQDETFQFDTGTFSALPREVQSRVRLPGGGLDGVHLRENFILRSNLMFVKAAATGDSQPVPDKVVAPEHAWVQEIWDNGTMKSKEGHEYVPHYAWTHTGSLFGTDVIQPDEYRTGDQGTSTPTTDDSGSPTTPTPKVNLPKWDYKAVNSPVNTQFSATAGGPKVSGSSSSPNLLFPMQGVAGTMSEVRGLHWSCEKRRPVFQGADFFVLVHRIASDSTVQTTSKPLLDRYRALDSRLDASTSEGAVLINGGVVETNEAGAVIDESRNVFDLNNQVYLMIEIGQDNPDHNYFLILAEKTYPALVHVGTAAVAVKQPDGTVQVVIPDEPVSRRLGMYEGVLSSELLKQDKLLITVRNYMGRLVITFSGYEDNPWVIERRDLISQQLAGQQGGSNDGDFVEATIPCVVPPAKLALHGGNIKAAFNWGYLKYETEVTFRMPQTIHIEGTAGAKPTLGDISLKLRGFETADRVVNPQNDTKYNHDALIFGELNRGGRANILAAQAQPYSYKQYGKGIVGTNAGSGDGTFQWPSQQQATGPTDDKSSILLYAENMRPVGGEDRAAQFDMWVRLRAGHFSFAADPENTVQAPTKFINVMTPICTGYQLSIDAKGCAFRAVGRDVSYHVLQFNETWTAQDYVRIEHSGTLKFLINEGMMPVAASDTANYGSGQGGNGFSQFPPTNPVQDQSQYLASLVDKTFYVRIKAWYEQSGVFPNSRNDDNAYIFTGLCHGGKIVYENNKRTFECHVCDLTKVLQDQFFLNSPYYDAVRDYVAVRDILEQATFLSGGSCAGAIYPAQMVTRGAVASRTAASTFPLFYKCGNANGLTTQRVDCRGFALPGSYDRLQNPVFRFKDGDRFMDAICRMANVAGKQVYFDRFGMFHYEDRIDTLLTARLLSESQVVNSPMVKERFYASPQIVGCNGHGQLAYNSYTWQRLAGDVVNQIMVVSASPEGALLVAGDKNYDMIDNPNAPGFLGYPKQFLQMNGVFGSEQATKNVVENYTTMYKPPLQVSFECFGRSYLKALDIITFTGIDPVNNNGGRPQPLRITNISTEIVPDRNTWWSKIDGEWLYPGDGVNWGN